MEKKKKVETHLDMKEIKELFEEVNEKLDELNKMDKGSKFLSGAGIIMMVVGVSGVAATLASTPGGKYHPEPLYGLT